MNRKSNKTQFFISDKMRLHVGEGVLFCLDIIKNDSSDDPELWISKNFLKFIIKECYCARCNEFFSDEGLNCKCDLNASILEFSKNLPMRFGKDADKIIALNFVQYDTYPYTELKNYWSQLTERVKKKKRSLALKSSKGKHSKDEINLLLSIQDYRCYYCGQDIKDSFTRDHVIPLDQWKSLKDTQKGNSIQNIVLSCRKCNSRKGALSKAKFIRCIDNELSKEIKTFLKEMRLRYENFMSFLKKGPPLSKSELTILSKIEQSS